MAQILSSMRTDSLKLHIPILNLSSRSPCRVFSGTSSIISSSMIGGGAKKRASARARVTTEDPGSVDAIADDYYAVLGLVITNWWSSSQRFLNWCSASVDLMIKQSSRVSSTVEMLLWPISGFSCAQVLGICHRVPSIRRLYLQYLLVAEFSIFCSNLNESYCCWSLKCIELLTTQGRCVCCVHSYKLTLFAILILYLKLAS